MTRRFFLFLSWLASFFTIRSTATDFISPFGQCETCGRPATRMICDKLSMPPCRDSQGHEWFQCVPAPNGVHRFCAAHQRESQFVGIAGCVVCGEPATTNEVVQPPKQINSGLPEVHMRTVCDHHVSRPTI